MDEMDIVVFVCLCHWYFPTECNYFFKYISMSHGARLQNIIGRFQYECRFSNMASSINNIHILMETKLGRCDVTIRANFYCMRKRFNSIIHGCENECDVASSHHITSWLGMTSKRHIVVTIIFIISFFLRCHKKISIAYQWLASSELFMRANGFLFM